MTGRLGATLACGALLFAACGGSVCGNGVVESGEQCDDGNLNDGDGCSPSCRALATVSTFIHWSFIRSQFPGFDGESCEGVRAAKIEIALTGPKNVTQRETCSFSQIKLSSLPLGSYQVSAMAYDAKGVALTRGLAIAHFTAAGSDQRRVVLEALRPIVDGRAADALITVSQDRAPTVRQLAAEALGQIRSRAALPRLLELTHDSAPAVAAAAVRALGTLGDARAVEPLLALLQDAPLVLQRAAAEALGRLRDPHTRPGLLAVARNREAPARAEAVWALGGLMRGQKDDEARELFEELLLGGDLALALTAIDALAALGDSAALPALAQAARSSDSELRRAALEVLGNFSDSSVDDLLVAALADGDDALRAAAAWALAKRGGSAGQEQLLGLANSHGYAGAVAAAAALATRPQLTGRAALERLTTATNPHVRANALFGMAAFPVDDALCSAFTRHARDPHKAVRAAAARALTRCGDVDEPLRTLARDPAPEVRRATETALGTAPPIRATDWLHIYRITELDEPLRHELYVLTRPDGLTKAGYTDLRGELGEEQVPSGTAEFDSITASFGSRP